MHSKAQRERGLAARAKGCKSQTRSQVAVGKFCIVITITTIMIIIMILIVIMIVIRVIIIIIL